MNSSTPPFLQELESLLADVHLIDWSIMSTAEIRVFMMIIANESCTIVSPRPMQP